MLPNLQINSTRILTIWKELFRIYRPGQPNWEFTMWKFQDFSATQILREFNFCNFKDPKSAILTISAALNFTFLRTFDIFKCVIFQTSQFKASKIVKTADFDLLKSAKIDLT